MKILLIDDQVDIQEIIAMTLEDELEANVIACPDTLAAEDIIKKCNPEEKVDVIISDYNLPYRSGLEFFDAINELNIPFILITGMVFDDSDDKFRIFNSKDNTRVLLKPFDDTALVAKIKEVL